MSNGIGLELLDIDTDNDAIADVVFQVRFSPVTEGAQTASVTRVVLGRGGSPERCDVVIDRAPVTLGGPPRVTERNGYRFFAGLRSDAFFADVKGAEVGFHWTGEDSFAASNVFGVVLSLPNDALGSAQPLGVWARVLVPHDGAMVQGDRVGRPTTDVFFNQTEDDKRAWNQAEPAADHALALDRFTHTLEHLDSYPTDRARELAKTLLPDILQYDVSHNSGYPNGRQLTDDVVNMGLAAMTGGAAPHDGLSPHGDLLAEFPYLGAPH